MSNLTEIRVIGLIVGALLIVGAPAKEWVVQGGADAETFRSVLERAAPGDTVRVIGGVYQGNFVVSKPLTLIGEQNPVLDGRRRGSVITLQAPRTALRGFVIRNSGVVLNDQDSAVRVQAPDCVVEHNRIEDALFGVHLDYAHRTIVRHNFIRSHDLPVARRGDQIRSGTATAPESKTTPSLAGATWCSGTRKESLYAGTKCAIHAMGCTLCTVATASWRTICSKKIRWAFT
jgi:nitrous oxidase accessory protein NosD